MQGIGKLSMSIELDLNWSLTPWHTDEPSVALGIYFNFSAWPIWYIPYQLANLFSKNKPCLTILNYLWVYFLAFKTSNFDKFKCKRVLIKSLLRNVCNSFVHPISTLTYSYCINALWDTQITYLRQCLNVLDRHGLRRIWTKILIDIDFIQGCTHCIYAPSADSIDL